MISSLASFLGIASVSVISIQITSRSYLLNFTSTNKLHIHLPAHMLKVHVADLRAYGSILNADENYYMKIICRH